MFVRWYFKHNWSLKWCILVWHFFTHVNFILMSSFLCEFLSTFSHGPLVENSCIMEFRWGIMCSRLVNHKAKEQHSGEREMKNISQFPSWCTGQTWSVVWHHADTCHVTPCETSEADITLFSSGVWTTVRPCMNCCFSPIPGVKWQRYCMLGIYLMM